MQEYISFACKSFKSLKHVCKINMPRRKRTEGVNWQIIGMRDAGLEQVDIARALNVSKIDANRLLMKQRDWQC